MSSKGRVKPSLNTLSRENVAFDERNKFWAEFTGPSDRACALVGSSLIDQSLTGIVLTKFGNLTKKESDKLFFDSRAILQTMSARIEIAYALELISEIEKNNIDSVRRIRNVFAHAIRPITFENELIIKECNTLPVFESTYYIKDDPAAYNAHRKKYMQAIMGIAVYLRKIIAVHPRQEKISKLVADPYLNEP